MATVSGRFNNISLTANASLTANKFVKLSSDGEAAVVSTAGDDALGVTLAAADANKPVAVQYDGIAMVEAGAAIPGGSAVTSNASGKAIVAATGNARIGYYLGSSAAASGDIISVLLKPAGADA